MAKSRPKAKKAAKAKKKSTTKTKPREMTDVERTVQREGVWFPRG